MLGESYERPEASNSSSYSMRCVTSVPPGTLGRDDLGPRDSWIALLDQIEGRRSLKR
jgi:hypothetical protein